MKKAFRSLVTFALALALLVTGVGGTAFAASSASGSIDGYKWSASVAMSTNSATAITDMTSAPSAHVEASVKVFYWWGDENHFARADGHEAAGYAMATATKKLGGAEVIGGEGHHLVFYNNTVRSSATFIGSTPSDAIEDK